MDGGVDGRGEIDAGRQVLYVRAGRERKYSGFRTEPFDVARTTVMVGFVLFGLLAASLIVVAYILLVLVALYMYIRVRKVRVKAMLNSEADPVFN